MSFKKRSFASYNDDGPPSHAPFAVFGTPLPAYDADVRDDGSFVPEWKQIVTDERGRKRFHGAFTGGWSAGYFNTVGSLEGFTSSSFVSSRTNRAKQDAMQQRVEDFMDEEDLAERAEGQKLETHGAFAGLGSRGVAGENSGILDDLFRETGETMGVKLLQRMGWRQGQGIGAKVRRRAQGDKAGEFHLFAPENSRMFSFDRKTDRKGLGYAGEARLQGAEGHFKDEQGGSSGDDDARILRRNKPSTEARPAKLKKKTGIGIGVLNDTGSDDEDPYEIGPAVSYNRTLSGDKRKKRGLVQGNTAIVGTARPTLTSRKSAQSRVLSGAASTNDDARRLRKCHDGRPPLPGFILSTRPQTILGETPYPPPVVPEGWVSTRAAAKADQPTQNYQSTAEAARTSTLNSASRGNLLGERQLPGKSVFDYLSPAARDKLVRDSGKTDLPPGLGEGAPEWYQLSEADKRRTLWDLVPDLARDTALAALARGKSGWMPYGEDDQKRARYRSFIELRAGLHSRLPERPKDVTTDDWVKEMREFAQAAEVFKPISGLMATRFTTASARPELASDALDQPPSPAPQKEEDPAEKAARLGMYGPLTRSKHEFYPSRLLCKRFNVRPPANVAVDPGSAPDNEVVPEKKRLDVVSQASIDRMMMHATFKPPPSFSSGGFEGGSEADGITPMSKEAGQPTPVDVDTNPALEGPRAADEVFKAVFGDDSGDDGAD